MSWQRVTLYGSTALLAVGLILRAMGNGLGLDLMVVAVFVLIVSVAFAQRSTQHALATARRGLTQRMRELGEAQSDQREAMHELTALQRTTLYYAKLRPAGGSQPQEPRTARSRAGEAGRAGRSSTPDVTNAAADESFASLLDPSRAIVVGGVLSELTRAALPEGTTVKPFVPNRAVESIDAAHRLDLVVLDEAALAEGAWARSAGPAGIPMMRDLLASIDVARDRGVATVVVPSAGVPDIHSDALRGPSVLRLPLAAAAADHAAGAPLSGVLRALDEIAAGRGAA